MNGSPFGRTMIYLSNSASCMILSHANQMGCFKQAFTVLKGRLFLGDDDGRSG